MQHVKVSVVRFVRLRCNSQLVVLGDGGGNAGKLARLMCGVASKNDSEEVTARVIELVRKFDRFCGEICSIEVQFAACCAWGWRGECRQAGEIDVRGCKQE
ncbi:hypothetical protein DsansV1_C05g0057411 [Dioscorea sansibarensis]